MKKTLLTAILLFSLSTALLAQTGEGYKYLGGSIYFNYNRDGNTTNYTYPTGNVVYTQEHLLNLNISPEFGFFMSKNWALGIQPGYTRASGREVSNFYSNQNSASNFTTVNSFHTDYIGLAVNLRYYWMFNDKVGIFPQFGVSTSHILNDFSNGGLTIGGTPNVVFFPTPKLGVNMGFGNASYYYNYRSGNTVVNLSVSNSFNFGLNYYWR
ncbi:hypothetical protein [Mucilaginibacter sp.]|uniref:hypothetical protein n=1 Tax=Mucilaginibacter sp. TaxID=1882438 RepID=UPI000CAF881B|nr:hypothetical protein [Mucilaginibacter sp.]HEK21294.1 hypothetical protein [Bacteroidota bacterium]PLW90605.1 MAG: hypothetical protein C0154_05490 [Mucilaginibacter sp.]PLW91653.1 MAG: hypothetical protein C0154_00060 [Mucilaginibacter sp.]PMP64758.1 MAG: hypothetical protein C0191_05500 [Mucilaginibacter sp.]PMP65933.1 MAG: hypothetical protein C0191_02100 [Mucilaginibacter sp.]